MFQLLGCQTSRRRDGRQPPADEGVQSEPLGQPPIYDDSAQEPEPRKKTFLDEESPKIGLILGPGGMKTFAHVGVLQAFDRAKIPVAAVVGMEWGALVAGLYSMEAQANDVDWKLFKLKKGDLPGTGLFSSSGDPGSTGSLDSYLKTVFANKKIETAKISFGCPAQSLKLKDIKWQTRGPYRGIVKRCMPYPPFFKPTGSWVASPHSLEASARFLRSKGANVVVFVDLIGVGRLMEKKASLNQYRSAMLWMQTRQLLRRQISFVDEIIRINTREHSLTSFSSRRALKKIGVNAGKAAVQRMSEKYQF